MLERGAQKRRLVCLGGRGGAEGAGTILAPLAATSGTQHGQISRIRPLPGPLPQLTAQQPVTCPPLRGLPSCDPTQGACERSKPRPSFPLFLLSLFHFG